MRFGSDERAQSTLVGAILLFAILIIAFSSYQAFVVPNQNAEVEFNHNSEVQTDMQDLRNSLLDVRSVERIEDGEYEIVSEHRPTRVRLGTQYPSRLVALNPPTPIGELRTSDPEVDFTISNARVTNPDAYEGDPQGLLDDFESDGFETRFLSYQPRYNEYRQAPQTGVEHSLLYNEFDNTDLPVKNQRLIKEKRLNIVLFSGDVPPASGQATTLDPETLDGPTAPISIEASNDNIEFTIPTNRPELWADEDVIGEEFGVGATHARVVDPDPEDSQITIQLREGETYQLRAMRVGFDGGSGENQFTPVQLSEPTPTEGEGSELLPGPRVFDAETSGEEPRQKGEDNTFQLTAEVSSVGTSGDERSGATIQAAEWYVEGEDPGEGNANEMGAIDGVYLTDVEVRVQDDEVEVDDLNEGENTLVIRGQDSRGVWGEDTDSVTVQVEGEGGAELEFASRQQGSQNSEILFSVDNVGSGDAVIEGISIDSTEDPQADRVRRNNGNEFERRDGAGGRNGLILIDGDRRGLDTDVIIEAGTQADFFLGQFRRSNGNTRNIQPDDVTVTFYLDDGTEARLVLEA